MNDLRKNVLLRRGEMRADKVGPTIPDDKEIVHTGRGIKFWIFEYLRSNYRIFYSHSTSSEYNILILVNC